MTPHNDLPPSRSIHPALCGVTLCIGLLCAPSSQARKPKPPHAASTPTTAQILAPSQATVPDALPAERTLYRCGSSYSSRPCANAAPLDIADARSDAQRRQAEALATRDRHLAQWMEAGRRQRESVASEPGKHRASSAQCVDTETMVCRPRKPRPRHSVTKAASAAAAAARLSAD